jgi:hypothetical protein
VRPSGPTNPRSHLTSSTSDAWDPRVSTLSSPTPPAHRAGLAPPVSPNQRALATTSPWCCPARRPSASRRALRLVFWTLAFAPWVWFCLNERAGVASRAHTSVWARLAAPPSVRKNVASPSSGAACYVLHHPVSRPSSRCVRELSDKRWGWESWCAPQCRVPTPHRRPAAGARAGDAAPGV